MSLRRLPRSSISTIPTKSTAAARAALTDAELFVSYNMPEKALGPLAAALPGRPPRHIKLNQRLAALYTRTGRFSEAALCCRTLQSVYGEASFHEEEFPLRRPRCEV